MEKFLPQDRGREISRGKRKEREIGARDKVKGFQCISIIIYVDF